jgi:rare lipoprotein A
MNPFPLSASCTAGGPYLRNVQRLCFTQKHYWLLRVALLLLLATFVIPSYGMGGRRLHPGETEKGLASWYGSEQQGDSTADGERFNRHALTAAHRHLPFNTVVRVTNQQNGKSVEVRINDRGPYRGGRVIDVSEAAADILDMKRAGTVPVLIEILQLGPPRHSP